MHSVRKVRCVALCLALLLAAAACTLADDSKQFEWWQPAPGPKPVVKGTVANVSATNIAVQTREGAKSFTVGEKTKVRIHGQESTIANVEVGDPVMIRFKLVNDNVPFAQAVVVPKPMVDGEIVNIEGNTIVVREVVKQKQAKTALSCSAIGTRTRGSRGIVPRASVETTAIAGAEHKVVVTNNTTYHSRGYVGNLTDLRIGYRIAAHGAVDGDRLVADRIGFMPAVAKGAVISLDNGGVVVKTVRQLTLELQPSEATAVLVRPRVGPNQKGTLADVKAGSPVNVGFHPDQSGRPVLLWIDVLTGV